MSKEKVTIENVVRGELYVYIYGGIATEWRVRDVYPMTRYVEIVHPKFGIREVIITDLLPLTAKDYLY